MLDDAQRAMANWQHGARTGEWSPLLAMLHPDVTFHVPVAEFTGWQRGRAAAERFFAHIAAIIRADLEVTSTLAGDTRAGFEVRVTGTMLGRAFVQGLCIVFTIVDGQIQSFAEYLAWPGGLDPARLDPARLAPGGLAPGGLDDNSNKSV
jgi:ketosteroid isomerase-like protein